MTTTAAETVASLGLTIRAEFVPFSRSRNAKAGANPSERSLNWRVTLVCNGRDILTADYSAGLAHCPSYKQGMRWTLDNAALIEHETETGRTARARSWGGMDNGTAILPKHLDVIYALVMDASVLDASSFEDWANELGVDPDSRTAEATYRACLEIALKMRNGIGEANLAILREAFQDY